MAEYIEKEVLRAHLTECIADDLFDGDMKKAVFGIDIFVENMPAADVQPVKRGKLEERIGYGGWGDTYYHCSLCGSDWVFEEGTPKANEWNFCPHCGADVRSPDATKG